MIKIKRAVVEDKEVLSLLGRTTYKESHGHFISDEDDLASYLKETFSLNKIENEIKDSINRFYIVYTDDFPIAYAKLVLNSPPPSKKGSSFCKLDKVYILSDFIPLKIGWKVLEYLEKEALRELSESMWLTVYSKNYKAIKFYERNGYEEQRKVEFLVNGTSYPNFIYSKQLQK